MAPSASNSTSIPLVRSEPDGSVWSAFMGSPPLLTNRTFDVHRNEVLQAVFTHWIRRGRTLPPCNAAARTLARHAAISELPGGCAADRWGPKGTPAAQISLRTSLSGRH